MSNHDETSPAFRLTPDRRVRTTFAVIGTIIAATASGVALWQAVLTTQAQQGRQLAQHETQFAAVDLRVKKLEDGQADIAVIKNNVEWIRREIERSRQSK